MLAPFPLHFAVAHDVHSISTRPLSTARLLVLASFFHLVRMSVPRVGVIFDEL